MFKSQFAPTIMNNSGEIDNSESDASDSQF